LAFFEGIPLLIPGQNLKFKKNVNLRKKAKILVALGFWVRKSKNLSKI
jgi:hypothetical protein